MNALLVAVMAIALVISSSANAVILNTLNDIDYQWLELTETQGMSRSQVEAKLSDASSTLFGYRYASRSEVKSLLFSYTGEWDGLNGFHGDTDVVSGTSQYLNDFGITQPSSTSSTGDYYYWVVEGYYVLYDSNAPQGTLGIYGSASECGYAETTCVSFTRLYTDTAGNITMAHQADIYGYSDTISNPYTTSVTTQRNDYGSFLVLDIAPVPVPAAAWLFASGLIGLAGFARRKNT